MSFRISVASTAEQLERLFRVRHEVFVGGGYMSPQPGGMIIDPHDAYPGAVNLVATVEERVVGGIRLDLAKSVGTGADDLYDYSGLSPAETSGGTSRLCVLPEYRRTLGLARTLWKMIVYVAGLKGLTHLRGSANPERVAMMQSLGWEAIGEEFHHESAGIDVVPMVLELSGADPSLIGFTAHQRLHGFDEVFERVFLEAGERVLTAGASGDEAYLVIEGEAVVKLEHGVRSLTAGDLFGELALMTDSPRALDVDAATDLELMALSRRQFEQQLVSHPGQALDLLRSLLTRYTESLPTGYVG
jgi:hypothetical protein